MPGTNPDPPCLCGKGKIYCFFNSLITPITHHHAVPTQMPARDCHSDLLGDPVVQHK